MEVQKSGMPFFMSIPTIHSYASLLFVITMIGYVMCKVYGIVLLDDREFPSSYIWFDHGTKYSLS